MRTEGGMTHKMANKTARFTFEDVCDVVLVRTMDMAEAHVAPCSEGSGSA